MKLPSRKELPNLGLLGRTGTMGIVSQHSATEAHCVQTLLRLTGKCVAAILCPIYSLIFEKQKMLGWGVSSKSLERLA